MKLADKKLFFHIIFRPSFIKRKKSLSELLPIELISYVVFYAKYLFFLATQIWMQHKKQSNFRM